MTSISERVARGAAWLDENRPGWQLWIDLDRLVLSSPCECVLGQIYGNYHDAPLFDGEHTTHGSDYGFSSYSGDRIDFEDLEVEWRRVITSRREATPDGR